MSDLTVKLRLVGPLEGKTRVLNGHVFKEGVCEIRGPEPAIIGACRYLGKCYNAHVVGSEQEKVAQAAWEARVESAAQAKAKEADNGKRDHAPGSDPNPADPAPSGVQPDGQGAAAPSADDGDGNDDGEAGASGGVPAGDGHPDARVPATPSDEARSRVAEAVTRLDPGDDDHWTQDGKPAVSAVSQILGGNVTRQDLDQICPGFNREAASAQSGS